jgi:hypothetical protein
MRVCARSDCSAPAAAILTYDREAQTAYLFTVDDPSTRTPGDLCERHLRRLVLPRSWCLDDRRENAAPTGGIGSDRLRAVPTPAPRTTAPRDPSHRKWAEIEPSLFDTPASDVAAPAEAVEGEPVKPEPATEPAWMPRFGPESELDDVLDAKTPMLRRAFGGR